MNDERDKSGEIEAFFATIYEDLWRDAYRRYAKSKVRAGYAFAEDVDLTEHPDQLDTLRRIWEGIVARVERTAGEQ